MSEELWVLSAIADPAANARIVYLGQILQGLVTAMMKRPAPNFRADWRQCQRRLGTDPGFA